MGTFLISLDSYSRADLTPHGNLIPFVRILIRQAANLWQNRMLQAIFPTLTALLMAVAALTSAQTNAQARPEAKPAANPARDSVIRIVEQIINFAATSGQVYFIHVTGLPPMTSTVSYSLSVESLTADLGTLVHKTVPSANPLAPGNQRL